MLVVGRPVVVGSMVMVVGPVVVVRAVVGLHIAVPRVILLQHGHRSPRGVCSQSSAS